MFDEARLRDFILPGIFAAIFYFLYQQLPQPLNLLAGLIAAVLAITACVSLVWYVVHRMGVIYWDVRRANAVTPESELARAMGSLSADSQEFLLERFTLHIERHLGSDGNVVDKLGPTGVPMDWVVGTFLPRCDSIHLAAVGGWSEGSLNRAYAQKVTDYFLDLGIALRDYKTEQAKWAVDIGPAILLGAFGYSLEMEGANYYDRGNIVR